jgi:hypothetical protein
MFSMFSPSFNTNKRSFAFLSASTIAGSGASLSSFEVKEDDATIELRSFADEFSYDAADVS